MPGRGNSGGAKSFFMYPTKQVGGPQSTESDESLFAAARMAYISLDCRFVV